MPRLTSPHQPHDMIKECVHCGLTQEIPALTSGAIARCPRCSSVVDHRSDVSLQNTLALALAGLILLLITNLYPMISLNAEGREQSMSMLTSARYFFEQDMYVLALLITLTCFVIPLFEMLALTYLLIPVMRGQLAPGTATLLRWTQMVSPWGMLEVLLLGLLISMIKLIKLATLVPGIALWSTLGLVGVVLAISAQFNPHELWRRLPLKASWRAPRPHEVQLACHSCALLSSSARVQLHARKAPRCPRCGAKLHERTPRSLQRASALALAALILYIPANVLPITRSSILGSDQSDTIMSGVIFFLTSGSWHIAIVIFLASVVIPLAKLFILIYLIISARWRVKLTPKHRTALYHMIEIVGRWSMVDVFVVSVLVALVRINPLAVVHARVGALYFAGVVILTILATEQFDPRLMWRGYIEPKPDTLEPDELT